MMGLKKPPVYKIYTGGLTLLLFVKYFRMKIYILQLFDFV